ncbi:MAG: tRNA uracil 4-sulfurtransferase ThiI [Bacillota bacterium]|nr:tRNA uracil 4-sulfurtransferase ThiI [Bacillota bacterium]
MEETILIKIGEIALKGLNRRTFEDVLVKNIRRRIYPLGEFTIQNVQSTISVTPKSDDIDMAETAERIGKIFGIAAYSRACIAKKDMDDIKIKTLEYLKDELQNAKTFKVEAKRSDKKFPLKSPEICSEIGGVILENFPHLTVDVHNPEKTVTIEVRDFCSFIRGEAIRGAGGIPVGTGGKAAILISGGIDSPVAAYMMAKRGIELTAIHFASPPYTSERAEQKVRSLLEIVSAYSGNMNMFVVPFTKIQETIEKNCPEELFTIIMRRIMMKISEIIAVKNGCSALITGESLGQVASQTIQAIACTDEASTMPVFRPLIGMDKDEIVTISRKIGTFETSILPFEDCCTVFTPKHPRTRPVLKFVKQAEESFDFASLIEEAIDNVRIVKIHSHNAFKEALPI